MDPLTLLLRLPFLPIEGVVRLGELIEAEVQRQSHDPARIRRELEEAQRRRDAGEITDEELARIEDQLTEAMVEAAPPSVVRSSDDGS